MQIEILIGFESVLNPIYAMDSDLDLDLRYFQKGGFDLDLGFKFIGFDLKKKIKSPPMDHTR